MDVRRRILNGIVSGGSSGGSSGPIDINNYLTIVALEDGLIAYLTDNACEYCVDGDGNWRTLSAGASTQSINTGHTLSFRGNLTPTSTAGIGTFHINAKCNLEGNCMSMLFGDNASNNMSLSGKKYAFYKLFKECANIVEVSEGFLPATTLTDYCYQYMFYSCRSLIMAPALPAIKLTTSCYEDMFQYCTSLTTAPALPATTLTNWCYSYMFQYCTSLTTAPVLPATTLANYCYTNMFYGCTKLTTAPVLPATTLADSCYATMFKGCSELNYIKMLATNISATNCLSNWVSNVASTGTFVKASATISLPTGNSGIPYGWTVTIDGYNGDYDGQ